MVSNSDDGEVLMSEAVTEYHFVNEKDEPICFSSLPVQWRKDGSLYAPKDLVFLRGKADNGLQQIYKQVLAWKVKLEGVRPEVWVLSKDKRWLKLLKPRKAYEDMIRKILITLQCLFYLKRKPASSDKSLWEHVRKVFGQFEAVASEHDLRDHLKFIQAVVMRDETLSKSQLLLKYLNDLPRRKAETSKCGLHSDQKLLKPDFINDTGFEDYDDDAFKDDGDDCFDTVCAICDNGGEVLCCEGDCLRSFHATKDAGVDSHCKTLGYTRAQVHDMKSFQCPNCLHKKHQCFACGKLGNSDKDVGPEVYRCISASCGHFYHPQCIAKLIHPDNEAEASDLVEKIAGGESFTCSAHKCRVCKQVENKEVEELQFAMCRRCPKSYHRKCLPRKISFEELKEEGIVQRAWDGLIPNRILIYCLKHKIDETIGTPIRNHITFCGTPENQIAHPPVVKRKAEVLSGEKISKKVSRMIETVTSTVDASNKTLFGLALGSVRKEKYFYMSTKISKDSTKKGSVTEERKMSMRDVRRSCSAPSNTLVPLKPVSRCIRSSAVATVVPSSKKMSNPFPVDCETKKRIMLLVKKSSSSSLTVEDLLEKRHIPTTYLHRSRHIDKTITRGKVEGSIQAIRAALRKLENGCSIEDAKAVCGADILNQIFKWKNKLRVYLAPFLHGMRYTSYGRHFTKVNKLEEIVGTLHWYVRNGDMIVDFCCGANDFSPLMKKKLEATGKTCFFRNYDLFQAKNDFNFEKRDWMSVQAKELRAGSQLIMGLNPPFGVKAALANKFIDKALEFHPKLLILIVPKETERLDKKPAAYDLIWEDEQMLAGKSFYLPGSVDVDDKQMEQWNVKAPMLYLWSRPDWTDVHKAIALNHGHTCGVPENYNLGADTESLTPVHWPEDHRDYHIQTKVLISMPYVQKHRVEGYEETGYPLCGQADGKMLENDGDRNGMHEVVENNIEKRRVKTSECPFKQGRTNKLEEEFERTADGLSDMDISSHQIDGLPFDDHLPFKAHTEVTTAMDGLQWPASDLGMLHGGTRNSDLPTEDIHNVDQRFTAPCGKFFNSSYDWPNSGNHNLNYDFRGTDEQFHGYTRDGAVIHFDPASVIGGERPSRPDIHTQIKMYGQQEISDSHRDWYASGVSSALAQAPQTSSFPFASYDGISSSAFGSSGMYQYTSFDELNSVGPEPQASSNPGDGSAPCSRPPSSSENLLPDPGSSNG